MDNYQIGDYPLIIIFDFENFHAILIQIYLHNYTFLGIIGFQLGILL